MLYVSFPVTLKGAAKVKVTVNSTSETTRELKIEVPADRIDVEIKRETENVRKSIQLPGFRKGKAPLGMIRAQYGKQIEAAAIEHVINNNYKEAINSEKLDPFGQANISDMKYEPGKPLEFTAVIEIKPEFTIGSLDGMRIEREEQEVTDEMLEETLKKIQVRFGTVRKKDGAAEMGDMLLVDIEEIDPATGVSLIGKQYPDLKLRLGEESLGPGFDEQLIGVKTGDAKRVVHKMDHYFITDPTQQQYQPAEKHHLVKIKEVNELELPEINDELAKEMEYENVEALRKGIKADLHVQVQVDTKNKLRKALELEIVRIINQPVPESMVERYLDNFEKNVKKLSNKPVDSRMLREENKEAVRKKVQWHLIREKLIEQEGFEITDQEVDDYLQQYAKENNMDVKRVKIEHRSGEKRQRVIDALLDNKIFAYLESKAEVSTFKKS